MASKQLGRLRQWAGEVISSREKTSMNEEFKELERDIELRKEGINRLITVSDAYHHVLSKKKTSEALTDGEKLLPVDNLGIVMILHGEDFGEDSTYGSALMKLGRAHCKIATLQEAFALTFKDTYIVSMERCRDEIKEYELLKKKLETRRSASDYATSKFEKLQNSKKDKDKREAEDEMERAKQRYEETTEDLRAHMHAIQENEHNQLHELTSFIDLETNYVQNYLDVLKDVKTDWQDKDDTKRTRSRRGSQSLQQALRPPSRSTTPRLNGRNRADSSTSPDSSDDDATSAPQKHSRNGSNASKTPSRPASRLSRKRANSGTASTRGGDESKEKDTEKEKEKERSRRMSVAGWASSAVESVTGSKNRKNKDKDAFATLDDDERAANKGPNASETGSLSRSSTSFRSLTRRTSKSKENLPVESSSVTPSKILKPPSMQERKVVKALYDFSGSSDELSFKAGNEIVVVNEVLDDWWMGEVDGRTGLFPTSYTEVIGSARISSAPATAVFAGPYGQKPTANGVVNSLSKPRNVFDSDNYLTSDVDDDYQELSVAPMAANKSPMFYGGFHDRGPDSASFTDTATEDEGDVGAKARMVLAQPKRTWADHGDEDWFADGQNKKQQQILQAPTQRPTTPKSRTALSSLKLIDPAQQPLINRSLSDNMLAASPTTGSKTSPVKKVPPPPPPRRTPSQNPTPTPPVPVKKVPSSFGASTGQGLSGSASSGSLTGLTPSSSLNGHEQQQISGYDRSPFESAIELELEGRGRCGSFRQNPFKPQGICSNCLEFH